MNPTLLTKHDAIGVMLVVLTALVAVAQYATDFALVRAIL